MNSKRNPAAVPRPGRNAPSAVSSPAAPVSGLDPLVASLRDLIRDGRARILRSADAVHVATCWEIGRHIVEFEQDGRSRAKYGKALLPDLAARLTAEFGKGFDTTNLRHMRAFHLQFPIRDALRRELSWTHYRTLLRVDHADARAWYLREAAEQGWSARALERQIGTLYYERLLASRDRDPVRREAALALAAESTATSPREFVRDPVLLEFLGLPEAGRVLEADLESALMDNLQKFLMELGKGFAFVARQHRVSTDAKDFYIDLVFYNYLLKCFVLFDLKSGELTHQDIGQMDMYVRLFDDLRRGPDDNPTVGIILCSQKDASLVRYSVLHGSEKLFATKYRLILPSEAELRAELDRERRTLTPPAPAASAPKPPMRPAAKKPAPKKAPRA